MVRLLSRPLCWTAALCCLGLITSIARAENRLQERIAETIGAPEFRTAMWGLLVVDSNDGRTIYKKNAAKLFVPASTTKLFTVAAALGELGADYRFETPIFARGEVDAEGRLEGDLILVASGDLTLGGRTDDEGRIEFTDSDHTYAMNGGSADLSAADPLAGLNELARQVADAGVSQVDGDVIIDDRLFETSYSSGSGPPRVVPITVNDNLIDFIITPGEAGEPAKVTWRPESSCFRVDARVETVASDESTEVRISRAGDRAYVVRGRIAADHSPVARAAEVVDPASFARSLLIEALERHGVEASSSALASNRGESLPADYEGCRRVALFTSPPFAENAKLILKVSHNLHASTLPLLVAAKHGERTLAAGLHRQRDRLAEIGAPVDDISFGGGAGGSRADYITPRAAVALLRSMAGRPDFAAYHDALPVIGVDGTLASVVDGESGVRGHVRAKTGTLYWTNVMNDRGLLTSKALAGYLTTASGRELTFAMFVNNVHLSESLGTGDMGRTLGKLCQVVYEEVE